MEFRTSKKMAFMVYTPSKILNANYVATCPIKHVRLPIYKFMIIFITYKIDVENRN